MDCETQPQLDASLFEKNIAALREVDAALAEERKPIKVKRVRRLKKTTTKEN